MKIFPLLIALALPAAAAQSVPAALQGEWSSGYISPVEYYNPSTGKFADASGTNSSLVIRADGSYEQTGLLSVTTYGCTSKVFVQEKGNVRVQGGAVTFTPKTSRAVGYMCSPSKVYEKRDHVAPHTEAWNVDGNVLRLAKDGGGSTAYDRR